MNSTAIHDVRDVSVDRDLIDDDTYSISLTVSSRTYGGTNSGFFGEVISEQRITLFVDAKNIDKVLEGLSSVAPRKKKLASI